MKRSEDKIPDEFNKADFFLKSTELRNPYKERACFIIRRMKSEKTDDVALVKIYPPLHRSVYGTINELDHLLLIPKHVGHTLFPISEWPTFAYICTVKEPIDEKSDFISSKI